MSIGQTRGLTYSFLSSFFRDVPSEGMYKQICELQPMVAAYLPSPLVEVCNKLMSIIEKGPGSTDLTWNQEYTLLFLTPHGVHPYESVYRGPKKRLMDDPWLKVKDFYLSSGIEKGNDEEHPDDHIAVELGFMAFLSFAANEGENENETAAATGLEKQFLQDHLLEWGPALCADIKKVPDIRLYHAIADFTALHISEDYSYLKGLCMEPLLEDAEKIRRG